MKTALLATALLAAPGLAFAAPAAPMSMAMLTGSTGQEMGMIHLEEGPRGVVVRLDLKGLKPGWHAVHFHAVGACTGPAFTSAGAHVHQGAAAAVHGLLNPQGDDAGDLPNVFAAADGTARAEFFTTLVSLSGAAGRDNLKDADGSAVVVHENADDYMSQPIGGAAARVACGVVR